MMRDLKSLNIRIFNFFSLILREKNFQIGIYIRFLLYLCIIFLFEVNFLYLSLSFALEFLNLCFISFFLPGNKYEVSKLIWLNPVFLLGSIFSPLSMLAPILILLIYISVIRFNLFFYF